MSNILKILNLPLSFSKSPTGLFPTSEMIKSLIESYGEVVTFEEASPFKTVHLTVTDDSVNQNVPVDRKEKKRIDDRNYAFETWLHNNKNKRFDAVAAYKVRVT